MALYLFGIFACGYAGFVKGVYGVHDKSKKLTDPEHIVESLFEGYMYGMFGTFIGIGSPIVLPAYMISKTIKYIKSEE